MLLCLSIVGRIAIFLALAVGLCALSPLILLVAITDSLTTRQRKRSAR